MSIQYPYTLQKLNVQNSTQDDNGDFVPGTSNWVAVGRCRNEDAKQRKVQKEDGSQYVATHLIQCPAGTSPIMAGQKIKVLDSGGITRLEGEVLYSSKDRFHTRIWV